jgi:uncharacterized membrane protein YgdD (TMEM256/DUF423 family)
LLWLIVLSGAVMAALAATIIDNRVKGVYKERAHNNVLLANECLAEHQNAYLIFAIGLVTGTTVFSHDWVRAALSVLMIFVIISYIVGVSQTAHHQELIEADHICPGARCHIRLPWRVKVRILIWNTVSTFVILLFCIMLCFSTMKGPG